jgi:TatD DNase family protein
MQLIDTHTHIYLPEFDSDRDETVERAISRGITKMLMPNIDISSVGAMLSAEHRFPGTCYSMIGLHPTSVKEDFHLQLDALEKLSDEHSFIAIGEIGIDLYWDKTFIEQQLIALRRQISFALEKKLPVVIHSRESFKEVFSLLDEFKGTPLKGVLHAFTGGMPEAEKAMAAGFKLGIGGIVTFKNSSIGEVVKEVGVKNIILETDSPYLAPAPYRGKRNESSYLCLINKKISEVTGMDEERVADITFDNSGELFNV